MVTFEARFIRTRSGQVYVRGPVDYGFLSRYLQVFDGVVVFARLEESPEQELSGLARADGPNVEFYAVPAFVGLWQAVVRGRQVSAAARRALDLADTYIIRVFGAVGTQLWRQVFKSARPYGVEVVSDPWDGLGPGTMRTLARPLVRRVMRRTVQRQCRHASVAAYVTESILQKRYPPGGWSTHYSSVELPAEAFVDEAAVVRRMARLPADLQGPYRVCFAGDFDLWFKAPDVMLDAVGTCARAGYDLRLVILGEGGLKGELQEQARRLGIADRVEFLGQLRPGQDVFNEIDRADLFVLPSRTEGLPRAVIEALARAAPCVGTNIGGFRELLPPEDLVPPNDPAALARKMVEVLRDRPRLEAMCRRNLATAWNYRSEELNRRRRECYAKLAEITAAWRAGRGS